MDRGRGTCIALMAAAAPFLSVAAAEAAEVPVGSAARPGLSQYDDVPGLWAGTTAAGQNVEDGRVSVGIGPGRCQADAALGVSLVARNVVKGRPLGRRRIRLRGAGRRTLTLTARRVDRGGIDPTSVATLTGRLPRDVVPAEPRRTIRLSFTVTAEEEGCLRSVSRDAARLLPTLYLRAERSPRRRIAPLHSPTRRLDGGAPARIGGPLAGAGLGGTIDPAGDVDGDGLDDVLLQQGELGEEGAPFRALVRFGGGLGPLDTRALGGSGFTISGAPEGGESPSVFAPAGSFLGTGAALALTVPPRSGNDPPGRRGPIVVVVPGRRYAGSLDPQRPPPGSVSIEAPRACDTSAPEVEQVGDVNGDGSDDLFVARPDDECGPALAGVVFGGGPGPVRLDALGAAGLGLDPDDLDGRVLVGAGDVNGDGLDDMAVTGGDDLLGPRRRELVLVLGRREAGTVVLKSTPGIVRVRGRSCGEFGDVAPAGDLNGDGAQELVIGIEDCDDQPFHADVAHILRGSRSLPARVRLGAATGTTIRARFGPLAHPALAAGRDVSGGPAPDIALGFPGGGPDDEGETWILRDPGVSGVLTLGALGDRGVRLLGGRESFGAGTDVAFVGDQTGDGRADLLVGASEEEFAGRPRAGTVYTYAAGAAPGPPCRVARTGSGRVRGTDLGDVLTGSPGPDRMVGFQGGDCIRGLAGGDRLVGDPGPDRLEGGDGNDRLNGGSGLDSLSGGAGADRLLGGPRGDLLTGGPGEDTIDALDGAGDRVAAGPGDDFIEADDRGRDRIDCGRGHDRVVADPGDRVRGCELVRRHSPPVYDD